MTDDIVERLRSRAEAPNAWTRDDFFLIEVADEIERLQNLLAVGFNEGFFDYEVHNEDEFEEWIAKVRKAIGEET